MKNRLRRITVSVWNGRIAPVFDVSERLLICEIEAGRTVRRAGRFLPGSRAEEKARFLIETGAGTLICGAISAVIQNLLEAGGVRVIPFVAGNAEEIIAAWLSGGLGNGAYAMPGCCGRGARGFGRFADHSKEQTRMNGRGQGRGGGRGMGRGIGKGGGGMGRGGGPLAAGPLGECVCPSCGHVEPHQRGFRCTDQACPECGTMMSRK